MALSPSHAHLTSGVIQQLFCDDYLLHEDSHTGLTQFAALGSVSVIGPNGQTIDVPVIGPARKTDEVQLSRSDALKLGIDAPICTPGDHEDTPGILIKGPRTQFTLKPGVVRALPHIHMSPRDADRLGLADRDCIDVASEADPQRILFRNVPVPVSVDYRLELHLDKDEGNAAKLVPADRVGPRKRAAMRARSSKGTRDGDI